MKKLIYFAFAGASALLLAACAKTDEQQAPKGHVVTLSASIEEDEETRAMVSDDGKFTWAEGDQIGVWTSDGKFTAFTLDGEGGSISGNFSAELADGVSVAEGPVVYPYNANHSYSDAQIGYYIPQTSNWDDGQTKSHMAAMCDGEGRPIQFKQLDGLLSFTLYNLPSSVRSFRLKTATSKIWSVDGATTFTVSTDQNLGNITRKTRTGDGFSNTYLNHTGDGTTGKIYQVNFPLPVGTYSDLQFEVLSGTGSDASVIGETKRIPSTEIRQASMVTMPALTYNYLELTYKDGDESAFRDNFNKYSVGSSIDTDGIPDLVSNEEMRSINNASKKKVLRITASGTGTKGGVFMIRTNKSDYNEVYYDGWRDNCKGFTLMIRFNSEEDIDKFYPHALCKGAKYRKDKGDPVDDIKRLPDRINGVPFTGEGQTVENWKKLIKAGEWNVLQWTNTHGGTFQIEVYPFLDFSGNNVQTGSANRIMYFDGFRLLK